MTDRTAWHCPHCGAWHGPHVDTCPDGHGVLADAVTPNALSLPSERRAVRDYPFQSARPPRRGLYDALGRN